MGRARGRCAWAITALALTGGCAGLLDAASPEAAVASLASALERRDVDGAYQLMSRRYREQVTLEEFRALFTDEPEIAHEAERLRARDGEAEMEATIAYGAHESVVLRREDGTWRVVSDVVDWYSQRTPRLAVRSFVRAVEARRWDVLLRLLPEADRVATNEEQLRAMLVGEGEEALDHLVAGMRAALDGDIEEHGDHATLPYGERFRVELVREGGVWCVADPD
ncbi:MAG: hypothetical protein U0234_10895 [Sandaracinus sp.]